MGAKMSDLYRLMIYFAVATLYFYRSDIDPRCKTVTEFVEKNRAIIDRVCDEAETLFSYELSHFQITRAIQAYLAAGQSVSNTESAVLEGA